MAEDDRDFLVELYGSVRAPELAHLPWDDATLRAFVEQQYAAQDAHYRGNYPGATLDVVEVDGERAGRLYVHRGPSDIRIMDIALLPSFRGWGIGTGLLRALLDEAAGSGRKLSIHVEANNPASTLYGRLGFRLAGEHGIYLRMEWDPTSGSGEDRLVARRVRVLPQRDDEDLQRAQSDVLEAVDRLRQQGLGRAVEDEAERCPATRLFAGRGRHREHEIERLAGAGVERERVADEGLAHGEREVFQAHRGRV